MTTNVTKFSGYAVLQPANAQVTKLDGYALLQPTNSRVTKLSGYAFLQIVIPDKVSKAISYETVRANLRQDVVSKSISYEIASSNFGQDNITKSISYSIVTPQPTVTNASSSIQEVFNVHAPLFTNIINPIVINEIFGVSSPNNINLEGASHITLGFTPFNTHSFTAIQQNEVSKSLAYEIVQSNFEQDVVSKSIVYSILMPGALDNEVSKSLSYGIIQANIEEIGISKSIGYSTISANTDKNVLSKAIVYTIIKEQKVGQWLDKSSNHFILTQNGDFCPDFVANGLNGLPLVQFNAALSQFLNFDRSIDLSGGYSYVGVLVRGTGTPTTNIETLGNTSGPNPDAIEWVYSSGISGGTVYIKSEIGYGQTLPFSMSADAIVISAIISSNNDVQILINGVDVTGLGFTQSTPDGTFNLFGFGDGTFTTGYFGEQKFWNGILSSTDLINETTAMMTKWGISLPM